MSDSYFVANSGQLQRLHVALNKVQLPFKITLSRGGKRSIEQNAYLWGVAYQTILDHSLGEQGWRLEDLHEYFLGEYHGWQTLEGFGRKRVRPIERSSGKSVSEFMDYISFVQQKAAEMGIYIPDPEEK